jgi:hypothetical protein
MVRLIGRSFTGCAFLSPYPVVVTGVTIPKDQKSKGFRVSSF